jgi:hypothetical protein
MKGGETYYLSFLNQWAMAIATIFLATALMQMDRKILWVNGIFYKFKEK